MLLPCIANFIIFHYVPMYGLQIAFKRYNIVLGAAASPWIGFKHFVDFFNSYYFWQVMSNTLRISILSIMIGFPFPIVFSLILNEVRSKKAKSAFQTVSYMPYFLSVVVVVGLVRIFFGGQRYFQPDRSSFRRRIGVFSWQTELFLYDLYKHVVVAMDWL